ncbi:cyclic nucleotide-binding domain-containing protein [Beijerinckia sp. L45]|uniref:cyclic nucleotide-binding domain-containing protein n=1 Tax=Beijerinckia sp. L45 TaxID=1641855 RepID=UPI00131BE90B|nr:mechanosensitive ion channel family protein [Beijerinckia sp. L45]
MLSSPKTWEMIADPIVQTGSLAMIGVLITRVALRHHPSLRLAAQVGFFTALTILLLYHGIEPYEAGPPGATILQRVFVGFAKLIWWMNAAWALVSFVRVFLIFERQPREGRLIQDLVVGMIYLGAALSVVAYVFAVPVGTLIATSGVFAIILGLALQNTLSDVFSGIALNLGRPYGLGDWIVLSDGMAGRVVETNWRATHLLNGTNDLVILPNSVLAKVSLVNLSSPDRSHGLNLTIRVVPTWSPATIMEVMQTVLMSSNAILLTPEPTVQIKAMDAQAIEIELSVRVSDMAAAPAARNELFDLIYRHVIAAGLTLAAPVGSSAEPHGARRGQEERATPLRLLDALPLFASLTETEKVALAGTMTRRTYRKDEVIAEQGTKLCCLVIIRSGAVVVTRKEDDRTVELARLAPGDCFGESGLLTGHGELGTSRALTSVVVYEIAQSGIGPLMQQRPAIAEELGMTFARRAKMEGHLMGANEDSAEQGSVPRLVAQIRHLFNVPHM